MNDIEANSVGLHRKSLATHLEGIQGSRKSDQTC